MRRSAHRLLVVVALTVAVMFVPAAQGAIAQPGIGDDVLPADAPGESSDTETCGQGPGIPGELENLCGIGGETQLPVVQTEVSLVEAAAFAFWRQLVAWFAAGLEVLLDALVSAANVTTRVDLRAEWFATRYGDLVRIGGAVMLPLFLAAVLRGLLVDRAELTRAVTMLPVAALATVVALPAGQLFVATIDGLSAGYEAGLGSSVGELVELLGKAAEPLAGPAAATGVGVPGSAFGFVLVALFLIFAAFVVWLELVLRQAGLYLLVLFLPLAFAGLVWAPTRAWLGRMLQAFAALVISKFVIVVVLSTAAAALDAMATDWLGVGEGAAVGTAIAGGEPFEQLSLLVLGVALVGLAAFAPYTVWRLIPLATAQASGSFEGVLRRGTAAVGRPHPVESGYNTVAKYDRARLLKDRVTPGGTSSLMRPGQVAPTAAKSGTAAGRTGAGAGAAGGAVPAAAAAVAVASKAKEAAAGRAGASAGRLAERTEAS